MSGGLEIRNTHPRHDSSMQVHIDNVIESSMAELVESMKGSDVIILGESHVTNECYKQEILRPVKEVLDETGRKIDFGLEHYNWSFDIAKSLGRYMRNPDDKDTIAKLKLVYGYDFEGSVKPLLDFARRYAKGIWPLGNKDRKNCTYVDFEEHVVKIVCHYLKDERGGRGFVGVVGNDHLVDDSGNIIIPHFTSEMGLTERVTVVLNKGTSNRFQVNQKGTYRLNGEKNFYLRVL